jgi:hypothetical protein
MRNPSLRADVFRFAPNIIIIGRPRLALRAYYRCPSVRRRFKVIFCVRMRAVGMAGIEARLVPMPQTSRIVFCLTLLASTVSATGLAEARGGFNPDCKVPRISLCPGCTVNVRLAPCTRRRSWSARSAEDIGPPTRPARLIDRARVSSAATISRHDSSMKW